MKDKKFSLEDELNTPGGQTAGLVFIGVLELAMMGKTVWFGEDGILYLKVAGVLVALLIANMAAYGLGVAVYSLIRQALRWEGKAMNLVQLVLLLAAGVAATWFLWEIVMK